jgi:hypothetical protein
VPIHLIYLSSKLRSIDLEDNKLSDVDAFSPIAIIGDEINTIDLSQNDGLIKEGNTENINQVQRYSECLPKGPLTYISGHI